MIKSQTTVAWACKRVNDQHEDYLFSDQIKERRYKDVTL